MTFDIIGKRLWFFLISGIVILVGVISLLTVGLKPGIEFSSGSMLTVTFEQKVDNEQLKQEIANLGYTNALIQRTGEGEFLLRTRELSTDEKKALEDTLALKFGRLIESQFYSVSPLAAAETAHNAIIAVAISMVGILLYVSWAFRKMPNPFRFGTCAIAALLHDVLVVLGLFSIIGGILGWEINLMFITGILAVIGYSVNNTVVVFDRIRENLRVGISRDFEVVVNNSLVETLGRTFNTTLTTVFTILALLFFVGGSIQNFVVVLLLGLIVGMYDSICVAPALLVVWQSRK